MINHLMLIDDDGIDQKMHKRVVEKSGLVHNIHPFVYADEALDYLREKDRPLIDAILLDIRMPRMDGFEFLEAATAEFGDSFTRVAVIMLTTSASENDKERARQFSVVKNFITKPLTITHLQEIDAILASDQS